MGFCEYLDIHTNQWFGKSPDRIENQLFWKLAMCFQTGRGDFWRKHGAVTWTHAEVMKYERTEEPEDDVAEGDSGL